MSTEPSRARRKLRKNWVKSMQTSTKKHVPSRMKNGSIRSDMAVSIQMDDSKPTILPKGVVNKFDAPMESRGSAHFLRRHLKRISAASTSPIFEFAFRFIRTLILARILSPNDVGAAVALAAILVSCETITDVGLEHFVVISISEKPAQVVAAARQVAIARSLLLGAIIFISAPYLALLFNVTAEISNIRWLAIFPLIGSMKNWRIIQIQNEYRFGPNAIARVVATMGSAASMIPAALWFRDARAMVVALGIELFLYATCSYLLVSRQKVAVVDPALRRAALSFGLPLIVNGIGLLILSQLDRMIVANLFGLGVLAVYSLSLNLVMAPVSVVSSVVGAIGLPFIKRAGAERQSIRWASLVISLGLTVIGAMCAVIIGLSLDWLFPLLYGPNFTISAPFQAVLTLITFVRTIRSAPNVILLVLGKTKHVALGNVMAGSGLLIAFFLTSWYHRVEIVAFGLLIGDLVSLGVLLIFVRDFLPLKPLLRHIGMLSIFSVGTAAVSPWIIAGPMIVTRGLILGITTFVIVLDGIIVYRRQIDELRRRDPSGF
jgi:O-antigen/teichoic acid export membrane protein